MQWRWARASAWVDITGEGGALATNWRTAGGYSNYMPAVCGEVLQAEGEAYAEFTWVSGYMYVGVARAGVDPSSVGDGLHRTADGWMYYCRTGYHYHNDHSTPWASGEAQPIKEGETVGLLLKQGSLSVYILGRQVGVMCTGLTGEFVWAADLDGSVRIARKPPPA